MSKDSKERWSHVPEDSELTVPAMRDSKPKILMQFFRVPLKYVLPRSNILIYITSILDKTLLNKLGKKTPNNNRYIPLNTFSELCCI